MMTAIILDQPQAAISLKNRLELICNGQVDVLATFDAFEDAIPIILFKQPDLVFTEVFLKDGNAFDYMGKLNVPDLEIIFMSASHSKMVRSAWFEPYDFLLKPIDDSLLTSAIQRCVHRLDMKRNQSLSSHFDRPTKGPKVILRTEEGLIWVNVHEIIRIEADRGYCHFYLTSGERIIVSKTLKTWEVKLCRYDFFRVHESHLVNLAYVKKFLKKDGGILLLENGDEVYVARRRKEDLIHKLTTLSIE